MCDKYYKAKTSLYRHIKEKHNVEKLNVYAKTENLIIKTGNEIQKGDDQKNGVS